MWVSSNFDIGEYYLSTSLDGSYDDHGGHISNALDPLEYWVTPSDRASYCGEFPHNHHLAYFVLEGSLFLYHSRSNFDLWDKISTRNFTSLSRLLQSLISIKFS